MNNNNEREIAREFRNIDGLSAETDQRPAMYETGLAKFAQRRIVYEAERAKSEQRWCQYDLILTEIAKMGRTG